MGTSTCIGHLLLALRSLCNSATSKLYRYICESEAPDELFLQRRGTMEVVDYSGRGKALCTYHRSNGRTHNSKTISSTNNKKTVGMRGAGFCTSVARRVHL